MMNRALVNMESKIILGTVQFGLDYGINNPEGKPPEAEVFKILDLAGKLGIQEIDTADGYGSAVKVLGRYLKEHPGTFKVMSKFCRNNKKTFLELFSESLERLCLSQLEGYYFHNFSDFVNFDEFDQVHLLKENGKLNSLAVSLYSDDELEIAVTHPEVDVIQMPFNLLDRGSRKIKLLEKAKTHNKIIYARSVFLQGLFFMDVSKLPVKLHPLKNTLSDIQHLASRNKISMQELCLNYVLHKNFIDKVVVGIDSTFQLNENMNSIRHSFSGGLEKQVEKIVVKDLNLLNPSYWS